MINESRNYSDVVQAGQKYGEEVGKVVGKFAGGLLALNLCATDCTFHVTKAALKAIYDTENAIANKATSYFPAEKHIKLALSTALVTGGAAAFGVYNAYTVGGYVIPIPLSLVSATAAIASGKLLSRIPNALVNDLVADMDLSQLDLK